MIGRYDRGVTRRVRLLSDLVAERDEILEEKVYLRGVHPPDKICARCKSECGPSIAPQHDTLCDACASTQTFFERHFVDEKKIPMLLDAQGTEVTVEWVPEPKPGDFAYMDEAPDFEKFWSDQNEKLEAKAAAIRAVYDPGLVDELQALQKKIREAYERPVPRLLTDVQHAIDCDMDEDCTCGVEEP